MSSLVDLFHHSVTNYSDKLAVVHNDTRWTYRELADNSNRVCSFLLSHNLEKGTRIAIVMENSPQYIATYYGILKAGGVVVALNTELKTPHLQAAIDHCEARWIFIDQKHGEFLPLVSLYENSIAAVVLPTQDPFSQTENRFNWNEIGSSDNHSGVPLDGDDNAAIIYTSGTTGAPKGVTLSHQNLRHNIESILAYLHITQRDKILNILPFYYSYGNSVLHTHICAGGCLVLENSLMYPQVIVEKMVKERVTGFSGVPSTYALLLNRVNLQNFDLSNLRYLTQAGGPMSPAHIERVRSILPDVLFFVMYGQTEATARIAYLPPEMLAKKMGSIGIPIPGVTVEIRDEENRIIKTNEVGEIFVHGKNIMKGYWRNPSLTQQVIKNGWLKTGDLAWRDEDGYLFIKGRSSDMIKSGAHRISPLEIEEVILQLPEIAEVAVVGVPDELLGEVIKAFAVVAKGKEIQARNIQAHCRKHLPLFKIPKDFEFVTELPKTASGKIKRFELSKK